MYCECVRVICWIQTIDSEYVLTDVTLKELLYFHDLLSYWKQFVTSVAVVTWKASRSGLSWLFRFRISLKHSSYYLSTLLDLQLTWATWSWCHFPFRISQRFFRVNWNLPPWSHPTPTSDEKWLLNLLVTIWIVSIGYKYNTQYFAAVCGGWDVNTRYCSPDHGMGQCSHKRFVRRQTAATFSLLQGKHKWVDIHFSPHLSHERTVKGQ